MIAIYKFLFIYIYTYIYPCIVYTAKSLSNQFTALHYIWYMYDVHVSVSICLFMIFYSPHHYGPILPYLSYRLCIYPSIYRYLPIYYYICPYSYLPLSALLPIYLFLSIYSYLSIPIYLSPWCNNSPTYVRGPRAPDDITLFLCQYYWEIDRQIDR